MTIFGGNACRSWRSLIAALAAAALWALTLPNAWSQNYPNRPIRLIVPTAAGSLTDVVARKVADAMSRNMGQPFVVENIAGAAGIIATEQVVRAAPDGYTLAIGPSTHAILPALHKLSYDAVTSITPIVMIASAPLVLVVPTKVPVRNTAELIAYARSKSDPINIGSPGVGTVIHLGSELLAREAGMKWVHVPYKGNSGLTTDLVGGQIDAAFLGGASAVPLVRSGKLRAIAVSTPKRSSALPDVPTLDESGVPGFNVDVWIAIVGPAGLPKDIVDRVRTEAQRATTDKGVQEYLRDQTVDVVDATTQDTVATFQRDVAKYAKVVKEGNIKSE
jgi:tripartite-type tricarboxylate transporter receptor subunit TctC